MRHFLAILRDSVREAVDTKVFFFMLGLAALVLLVVASISFRPLTVQEEVTSWVESSSALIGWASKGRAPTWSVTDFEQTNAPAAPWDGDYRFTFRVRFADAKDAEEGKQGQKDGAREVQRMLHQRFRYLKDLQVTPRETEDPAEAQFDVTTHGTAVSDLTAWPHVPTIFFAWRLPVWHQPLGMQVHTIEDTFVNTIGAAVALLVSTIITAFFIPNMLRKGTIDLLLAKPVHRTTLLIYKYVGGLSFMFLLTSFVVVGIWLIVGLRTGLWGTGFLLSIPILTFEFAMYYAVSTLFAVLTRSPIVAILMTCVVWLVLFLAGLAYTVIDTTRKMADPELAQAMGLDEEQMPRQKPFPDWVYTTTDAVHFVLPRVKDLDQLTARLVIHDLLPADSVDRKTVDKLYASFNWGEALGVTALYIAVLLGLSCWRFVTRDY